MTIGSILSIAAGGLTARDRQLAAIASNVANSDTPGYRPLQTSFTALETGGVEANVREGGQGTDDLAAAMTGLVEARLGFAANAAVFETGASLWDMLRLVRHDGT